MKVTMLLADAAQAVEGKLYVLGGGWSLIGPAPTPMALAIKIEVPWSDANRKFPWAVKLLDEDGRPVHIEEAGGTIEASGTFEVGRPSGLKAGTPLDFPLAIQIGPLPLRADSRYTWRLEIDNLSEDDWFVSFTTRPAPSGSR